MSTSDGDLKGRLAFMGMDDADQTRLQTIKSIVMAEMPSAIAGLYKQLRNYPETKKHFSSDSHMDAAGKAQIQHWDSILNGRLDENYVRAVTRIGEVHARIGLEPRWYIGGYARMVEPLIAAILKSRWPKGGMLAKTLKPDETAGEIGAFIKAVLLDIDFAISIFMAALERKRLEAEAAAADKSVSIQAITGALSELANGNLTHRLPDTLQPEYVQIGQDFNAALAKLQETLGTINGAAGSILSGSVEITHGADELARRTEQQAASIEETAAALAQITDTVRKTADGAEQAREVVSSAKKDAERSGSVVRDAVAAMGQIEKSSNEISQIIGVIDEIAFQTNLLALNAGVEAARAGDAGRGFAVVASEVRALAQRSAGAAKEIKALISAATMQVGSGVKLVGEAGQALQRISGQVGDINDLVVDIATSAKMQASSLNEINSAVTQMDQMTQQNAAMVQESTAASHSLAADASELGRMVGQFEIGGSAATPSHEPRRAASEPARASTARGSHGGAPGTRKATGTSGKK